MLEVALGTILNMVGCSGTICYLKICHICRNIHINILGYQFNYVIVTHQPTMPTSLPDDPGS